jgi:hypothetical protein
MEKEEIQEKIEKGWIHARMWFEVLAVDKQITENSLKEHIGKLKKEPAIAVISEKYEEAVEVERPMPNVEKGFSQAVEVELLAKDVTALLYNVIFYAPSAVEILKPEKLSISAHDVQVIMNSIADVIHRFASRTGGVLISAKK